MTAATKSIKDNQYGVHPIPDLLSFPVAAATKLYAGTMVATDASGNAVPASANPALKIWGRAEFDVDNSTGAAGDLYINVRPGFMYLNAGTGADALANSNRGADVYASDDNTVNLTDAGGQRPLAGYLVDVPASGQANFGKVLVAVAMSRPDVINPELQNAGTSFRVRAVATSIAAYTAAAGVLTASATGTIGAQDGVTLVAGDALLVLEGMSNVTASDAGPYYVTNAGTGGATGANFVLTRPDWWPHGSAIPSGVCIESGGEGSLFKGTSFKSFAVKGKTIGTDAPALYPSFVAQSVTLAAGLITITNVPILSATKTVFPVTRTTLAGSTGTVSFNPSGLTAGILGAASVIMAAQGATGTTVVNDTSTIVVGIHNW